MSDPRKTDSEGKSAETPEERLQGRIERFKKLGMARDSLGSSDNPELDRAGRLTDETGRKGGRSGPGQ